MSDLLKVLPIYILMFLANLLVAYFNVTILLSRIKSGVYQLPFIDKVFQTWWGFTLAAWAFNSIFCYVIATLLVTRAYKYSIDTYGVLISAFVISQIMSVTTHMFFFYLRAREMPTRNEGVALVLIVVAAYLITRPVK